METLLVGLREPSLYIYKINITCIFRSSNKIHSSPTLTTLIDSHLLDIVLFISVTRPVIHKTS